MLCNAMLLTEGWDCPSVDCIVVLRPTKIRSLYVQMVGRGTRPAPGKENLLILDFLWMTQRHNLSKKIDLCKPADLAAEKPEDREAVGDESLRAEIDLFDAASDAVEARRKKLAEELAAQRHKKSSLIDPLQWFVSIGDMDLADYVLGHFSGEEKKIMEDAVAKAAEAAACAVTDGIDLAMNRYNTPRKKKKRAPKENAEGTAQEKTEGSAKEALHEKVEGSVKETSHEKTEGSDGEPAQEKTEGSAGNTVQEKADRTL